MTKRDASSTPNTPQPEAESAADARDRLEHAAAILLPGYTAPQTLGGSPHLLRVSTPDGLRLIRRWEPATTAQHIGFVARALDRANAAEVSMLPRILPVPGQSDSPALLQDGRLFTASTWLEGRPFARYGNYRTPDGHTIDVPVPTATPVEDVIFAAARVLGRFHVATREMATENDAPRAPLSVFLKAATRQWQNDKRYLGDKAAGSSEIRRWLRCGNRVMGAGPERLEATAGILDDTGTVVHGDLWPTHLLVTPRNELSGITGWAAMTTSSPVLDLVQLAGHVKGWTAAITEDLVGAYHETAPLTPEQRRAIPVVAAIDLVGRVARLLELAFLDERMIGHEAVPSLRSGVNLLLHSLETLTNVLVPEEARRFQPARMGAPGHGDGKRPDNRSASGPRRFGSRPTPPGKRGSAGRSRPGSPRGTRKES
ncbi:MAG: aminoglycoside phosphotransferase family protein [Thermomicrobiales bacterium]